MLNVYNLLTSKSISFLRLVLFLSIKDFKSISHEQSQTIQHFLYSPENVVFVPRWWFVRFSLLIYKQILQNERRLYKFNTLSISWLSFCFYFRAFDLANHFCEWMFDYSVPPPQYFSMSLKSWPSKEQQVNWLQTFIWCWYQLC